MSLKREVGVRHCMSCGTVLGEDSLPRFCDNECFRLWNKEHQNLARRLARSAEKERRLVVNHYRTIGKRLPVSILDDPKAMYGSKESLNYRIGYINKRLEELEKNGNYR